MPSDTPVRSPVRTLCASLALIRPPVPSSCDGRWNTCKTKTHAYMCVHSLSALCVAPRCDSSSACVYLSALALAKQFAHMNSRCMTLFAVMYIYSTKQEGRQDTTSAVLAAGRTLSPQRQRMHRCCRTGNPHTSQHSLPHPRHQYSSVPTTLWKVLQPRPFPNRTPDLLWNSHLNQRLRWRRWRHRHHPYQVRGGTFCRHLQMNIVADIFQESSFAAIYR